MQMLEDASSTTASQMQMQPKTWHLASQSRTEDALASCKRLLLIGVLVLTLHASSGTDDDGDADVWEQFCGGDDDGDEA